MTSPWWPSRTLTAASRPRIPDLARTYVDSSVHDVAGVTSKLAGWLSAEDLPAKSVTLPSGRTVEVPRLLRQDTRRLDSIPRTSSCWAPNKPTLDLDGQPSWAEIVLVELLERHGWEARWVRNLSGGHDFCHSVGQPKAMLREAATMLAKIDHRARKTGAGAWDVWAWKGGSYLCLESRQHQSGDSLRPNQLAWLEAAITEGVTRYAVVEWTAPRP